MDLKQFEVLLKNKYKWPKTGFKNTKWPIKDHFLDQCSQAIINAARHLSMQSGIHHEIKVVNMWLVFIPVY
jgi:hypothetical protein